MAANETKPTVLVVDDEPRILESIRALLEEDFKVESETDGARALGVLDEDSVAVILADQRMPGLSGDEFLAKARETSDATRILLTGYADMDALIRAVNDGGIHTYVSKPWEPLQLKNTVSRAAECFRQLHQQRSALERLIETERELLENTLRGSVGVLSEILGLVNPPAFGRAQRIRRYVLHMAESMNLENRWQYELAAMLSQIGCVTVPAEILERSYDCKPLSKKEQEILSAQSKVGHDLLAKIPRLEKVAQMVAQQGLRSSGAHGSGEAVTTGSHLLQIASDMDEQLMRGYPLESVLDRLRGDPRYNSKFLGALQQLQIEEATRTVRSIPLSGLRPQMIANAGIYCKNGVLLLAKGQVITESALARLNAFSNLYGVVEPISVLAH
jgi:response regulator RpfG family c-di-GMP phosphodiesterase